MWRRVEVSQIDVPAMWAAEEALTDKQRRHRYKCRDRYKTIRDMHPWTYTMVSDYPEIHKVAPAPAEEPKPTEASSSTETPSESTAVPTSSETQTSTETAAETTQAASSTQDAVEKLTDDTAKLTVNEKSDDPAPAPFADSDSDSDEPEIRSKPKIVYAPNAALNRKVCVYQGDITSLEIDAIVNAANRSLLGGGGVDGAIHSAAGGELYTECLTLNGASTGETKITRGYNLPAKYVLHTVGPIGEIPEKLESCYQTCLDLVEKHNIKTVAFCGVSTGIYGYPRDRAAHVALRTVRNWLEQHHEKVDRIIFVNFLDAEQRVYLNTLPEYFPPAYDPEYFNEYAALVEQWAKEPREPISDSESESEGDDPANDDDDSDSSEEDAPVTAPPVEPVEPVAPAPPADTPDDVVPTATNSLTQSV